MTSIFLVLLRTAICVADVLLALITVQDLRQQARKLRVVS
jgi:hypothetical protein